MTIQDMIDEGVVIQGEVVIKSWVDEKEDYEVFLEREIHDTLFPKDLPEEVLNAEVKFLYPVDGQLVFEIEDPELGLER